MVNENLRGRGVVDPHKASYSCKHTTTNAKADLHDDDRLHEDTLTAALEAIPPLHLFIQQEVMMTAEQSSLKIWISGVREKQHTALLEELYNELLITKAINPGHCIFIIQTIYL